MSEKITKSLIRDHLDVPSTADWGDHKVSLDINYAYELFFGKSIEDAARIFGELGGAGIEELRNMPEVPFRFYLLALGAYLLGSSRTTNAPWASRGFLDVANERVRDILPIIGEVQRIADEVAERQNEYNADKDIFGDFVEEAARLRRKSELMGSLSIDSH